MAYATGSAASCSGVIQSLAAFCTSYGWTVDRNAAYSGGWWLAVHKGSCYFNFVVPSGDGFIVTYGASGYNSSLAPSAQPGASDPIVANPGMTRPSSIGNVPNPGPYTAYHFFSSSAATYLHILVESSAGVFAHVHAGALNSVGGASPVAYLTASYWFTYVPGYVGDSSQCMPDNYGNCKPFTVDASYATTTGIPPTPNGFLVGCTVDSTFRWFMSNGGTQPGRLFTASTTGYSGSQFLRGAHVKSPNTWNGLSVGVSIPVFAERASGGIYSFIGEVPDTRFFNMKNNNAKDEITIGSDVWKVFPIISNSPVINTPNAPCSSYPYGLAFKKSA